MLSFSRKRLLAAFVLVSCAVMAAVSFGPGGKAHVPEVAAPLGVSVPVSLPNIQATPGLVMIPITVGSTTGLNIISYDLQITYDPAVLVPASPPFDTTGTLSANMLMTPNTANASHLILSAFQAQSLTGSGVLVILKFNVIGTPGQSSTLVFADYTDPGNTFHFGFVFNEGIPGATLTNGSVTIPGGVTLTPSDDPTPTSTATRTLTNTPTQTNTPVVTPSSDPEPTNTPTSTATRTPTNTPTITPTVTATAATTPTPPQYQIFDIGLVLPTDSASQGEGASTGGMAVGRSIRTNASQAFVYTQGGGLVGLPNLAGRPHAVAQAAVESGNGGIIVGTAATTLFGSSRLPVEWSGGTVSQLPLPPGQTLGEAFDVNSSGIAVGSVDAGISQRGSIYNGASGAVITATTSNGGFFTVAFGINDSGRVAGIGVDPNNAARNVPMVWDVGAGSAIDIGALPGFNGGIPFAVGNGGHVVGSSMLNQGSGLPFIWTPGGGMVAIPLAVGTSQGSARGVNSFGWAVGTDSSAFAIPFLYTGNATYRLQDIIPAGTGWDLSMNTSSSGMGISDSNVIVGTGVLNGNVHAFYMAPVGQNTPTPTPTTTDFPTPDPTPTRTATNTPTFTPTASPTGTCFPFNFANSAPITINDNAPGSPYPSNITVSGLSGTVTKVTVDLRGVSHTFPDDIDIMLVGPGGQNTRIMSDVGSGGDIISLNFTFDDAAATTLPDAAQLVGGTFKPSEFESNSDVFPAPAPVPGATTAMSVFNGTDPNGVWSLYVRDDLAIDAGNIAGGWALHISTTQSCGPTPTPTATITATPTASPSCTPASGFVYALADDTSGDSIYGFALNATTGSLTALSGFPVAAGTGAISLVSERMAIDQTNGRLYVVNDGSDTVSAYSINRSTGALTPLPFSPISLGTGVWNTIAVHPSGSPLVIANNATNGQVLSFAITGTTAMPAPGSPYLMGANVAGFSSTMAKFGGYYYVGGNIGNFVGGFSINPATGALTQISGAPFDSGGIQPLAQSTDSTGRFFAVDTSNNIRAFTSASGALTPVTGNPFPSGLTGRRFGLTHEYAGVPFYFIAGNSGDNVGVYQVSGSGAATTLAPIAGSPFLTNGNTANALAMNETGDLLFVANRLSRNLTTFRFSTVPAAGMVNLGVQPSNTLGNVGTINGIGYIAGSGTCGTATPTNTPTFTATATATPSATGTASGTPPSIQFSSVTYMEDESQTAMITITRTGNLTGTDTAVFTPSDGTATGGISCLSGADYLLVPNPLVVFMPGDTTATAILPLCADNITEPDETVNLTLTGQFIGTPSTAVLTINDTASQFKNATNIAINGGASSSPYPSTITVSGGPPAIGSMRVTIYDYSTAIPINVGFLLVGPTGQAFVLMANAGGLSPGGPVTLNFTDTAGRVLPANGPLTTNDFEPTSYNQVAGFPAPAPTGPYNLPGSTVGGTGTQTLFGNFGGTNANGVWSLYVREQVPPPSAPSAIVGNIAGGWGLEFLSSTVASGSISGRVTTANGNGIRNATVTITGNSLAEPRVATTGSFGYYVFDGLTAGETYVLTVNSQRYTFSAPSRVISLVDNVVDADFVADPQE